MVPQRSSIIFCAAVDVLAKDIFARVAGKPDEVEIGDIRNARRRARTASRRASVAARSAPARRPDSDNGDRRRPPEDSFHHESFGAISDANHIGAISARPPTTARIHRRGGPAASESATQRTQNANTHAIIKRSNALHGISQAGLGSRSVDGATRTTCNSGKPASTYTGSESRISRCPNASASTAAVISSNAGAEDLGAEPEPGEVALRPVARPVDADIDERRHDEQQQKLHEIDAKPKRRHGHEQHKAQAGDQVAHEVGGMMAHDQRTGTAFRGASCCRSFIVPARRHARRCRL